MSLHVHPQIITSTGHLVTMGTSEQLPLMTFFMNTKNLLILQPAKSVTDKKLQHNSAMCDQSQFAIILIYILMNTSSPMVGIHPL
jgi:hypothetical protein